MLSAVAPLVMAWISGWKDSRVIKNIEKQLDEVIQYLEPMVKLQRRISGLQFRIIFKPITIFTLLSSIPATTSKVAAIRANARKEMLKAFLSKSEVDAPEFKIVVSEYPNYEIGRMLSEKFPTVDFEKLQKAYAARTRDMLVNPWKITGFVLAAFSLFLEITPEVFINTVLHWDYQSFKLHTFYIEAGTLLYISVIIGFVWLTSYWARVEKEFLDRVFEYAILNS